MNTRRVIRRDVLKAGLALAVTPGIGLAEAPNAPMPEKVNRNGRIRQAVCRWCYPSIPLDDLCAYSARIGLKGIDLLDPQEWSIPQKYGLICTLGNAGGGDISNALNRPENHAAIEAAFRKNIPLAAKLGVSDLITFSGNRNGISDAEGARNTVVGLNRIKKIAEDYGVTINLELLNSRKDHHDYMADHTAWGVAVVKEVDSARVKLLYDIYHMQIMEGDLIATIRANLQWIAHFHTGGVPGRHELDGTQEVQWDGVMRTIADAGFRGYVAHEFVPVRDPLRSLRAAVDLCDV